MKRLVAWVLERIDDHVRGFLDSGGRAHALHGWATNNRWWRA